MTQDELALFYGMYERAESALTDWQRAITYGAHFIALGEPVNGQQAIKYGRILTPADSNGADSQIQPHYFAVIRFRPLMPPTFETIHTSTVRAVLTRAQMDQAGAAGWPQTMHGMLVAIVGKGKPVVVPLFIHNAPLLTQDGPVFCVATNEVLGTVLERDLDAVFGTDGYVFSNAWRADMQDLNNVALTWVDAVTSSVR